MIKAAPIVGDRVKLTPGSQTDLVQEIVEDRRKHRDGVPWLFAAYAKIRDKFGTTHLIDIDDMRQQPDGSYKVRQK